MLATYFKLSCGSLVVAAIPGAYKTSVSLMLPLFNPPLYLGLVYSPNLTMLFETSRLSVDTLLDLILMKLPEEARSARYCSELEVCSIAVYLRAL